MHEFIFGRDHYGATEPGREFPDDLMPEEDVTLTEALGTRKTFEYLYDFGDSWWHKINVEQTVKLDSSIEYAQCVGGENVCPPEDMGGSLGYEEFLEALADPQHPEHTEVDRTWHVLAVHVSRPCEDQRHVLVPHRRARTHGVGRPEVRARRHE